MQGLTEYLPISSTAHIRVLPALLGWKDPGAAYTAAIQIGTLLAIVLYFWKDLSIAITGWLKGIFDAKKRDAVEYRIGWAVFIGTLPIVVCGVLFRDQIENSLRSLYVVAGALIGFGALLGVAEVFGRKSRDRSEITIKDGLWVGIWQALALIPGASRSGTTITGAMFARFDRASAARFSFLLSIPSLLIAAVASLLSHRHELLSDGLASVIVANVLSFVVGYAAIAFLMKFVQTRSLLLFVVYRFVLGAVIFALLALGTIPPV